MSDEPAPALRIVRGSPDADEIAALVSVLVTAARGTPEPAPSGRSIGGWADRWAGLRQPVTVGPGAWVSSGRARGARTRAAW